MKSVCQQDYNCMYKMCKILVQFKSCYYIQELCNKNGYVEHQQILTVILSFLCMFDRTSRAIVVVGDSIFPL